MNRRSFLKSIAAFATMAVGGLPFVKKAKPKIKPNALLRDSAGSIIVSYRIDSLDGVSIKSQCAKWQGFVNSAEWSSIKVG